jgi:hypothetical protein
MTNASRRNNLYHFINEDGYHCAAIHAGEKLFCFILPKEDDNALDSRVERLKPREIAPIKYDANVASQPSPPPVAAASKPQPQPEHQTAVKPQPPPIPEPQISQPQAAAKPQPESHVARPQPSPSLEPQNSPPAEPSASALHMPLSREKVEPGKPKESESLLPEYPANEFSSPQYGDEII